MNESKAEASRWLEQAEDDLDFARHAMAGEFFHQVCFISQQAAEKALKALHIPTRYPNGLVEGTPRQAFTRSQAERALAAAETILGSVKTELGD